MSLSQQIIDVKPRETAGSSSASRFDFQKHWALSKLLELHLADLDYRVLFDYHDDVVVLEPATNPTQIHFYQVKGTKRGHWTRGQLLNRAKDDGKLSILGKLLTHLQEFPDDEKTLNLVSNAPFKLKANNGSNMLGEPKFVMHGLASDELDKIRSAVKEELGLDVSCADDDIVFLHVTSLSLMDHASHLKGRIVDFLEKTYPGSRLSSLATYKALLGEVSRRTGSETIPTNYSELCEQKSLCRDDISSMLSQVKATETYKEIWTGLEGILHREGFGLTEVADLRNACIIFLLERLDPSNSVIRDLDKYINEIFDTEFLDAAQINCIHDLFQVVDRHRVRYAGIACETCKPITFRAAAMVIAHERAKL